MTIDRDDPRLDQIAQVNARIAADPAAFLRSTTPLSEDDFNTIGKLVQIYAFADLNARRIIDVFRRVTHGAGRMNASRLNDADVLIHLRTVADALAAGELKDGIVRALWTLELHRIHRHNFAHWAARRLANTNVIVIFTKNAREAERRDSIAQAPDELKYGVLSLDGFSDELGKLGDHAEYLARVAGRMELCAEEHRPFT